MKSTKTGTKMDGFFGWIVTLDVLKCHYEMDTVQGKQGWIVTLDVLKSRRWVFL